MMGAAIRIGLNLQGNQQVAFGRINEIPYKGLSS